MFIDDFVFTIIGVYRKNLKQIYSISDIANITGKKYAFVHKKVMELVSLGVLRSISFGRAHLCAFSLENPLAQLCLGIFYTKEYPLWSKEYVGALRHVCKRVSAQTVVFDGKSTVYVASHKDDILDQQQLSSLQVFFTQQDNTKEIRIHAMDVDAFAQLLLDDTNLFSSAIVLHNIEFFCEIILAYNMAFEEKYSPLYSRGEKR